jgi:homoserine/homoserine lactone efflux protein
MSIEAYIAFCLTAFVIVIVPGPTVTVVIANSLRYGTRAGLMNVAGTQAGLLVWMTVAVLGLASAIQFMGWWFDVLKFAGAAYLVYLGIRLLRAKGELLTEIKAAPKGGFFLQGFVVILSNPKVLLVSARSFRNSSIRRAISCTS